MNIRKITEEEVRSLWVQRLPDTPNRAGRFGAPGMSASEIKKAYDALALRIVERYNELVDSVLAGEVASTLPTGNGDDTLEDFFADVKNGELATYLTVDGERALSALAAAFDCHDHDGEYAPLVNGKLSASLLPDGYESVFADAEADRAAAELERAAEEAERVAEGAGRGAAEGRREALMAAFEETIAAIEESEAERDRRLGDALQTVEEVRAVSEEAAVTAAKLSQEVANLRKATEGVVYEEQEDARPFYRKIVPNGALPYAAIASLGGGCSGATAIDVPDGRSFIDAAGTVCGYTDGGVFYQSANPGVGARWEGIDLVLVEGAKYTIGFEIFVDPLIPTNTHGNYSFGITRNDKWLLCISTTCPQRGSWVRRTITFTAPSRLTEDGYLSSTGELFLGYTGADELLGTGVRFRHVSVTRGDTDTYIPRNKGIGVDTTAVVSHGANLVPYPYPAAHAYRGGVTSKTLKDGTLILNGEALEDISFILYNTQHGLDLPEGEVYIHSAIAPGVELILITGEELRFQNKAVLSRDDQYFGRYFLYLYIHKGTVFENKRILPFLCLGGAREPVMYRAPIRYEIPEEVRALPGYGITGNHLDLEAGVFRQTVDEEGIALAKEAVTPLPEDFVRGCVLPVEAGGFITMENAGCEAVDSTVIYEIKKT